MLKNVPTRMWLGGTVMKKLGGHEVAWKQMKQCDDVDIEVNIVVDIKAALKPVPFENANT